MGQQDFAAKARFIGLVALEAADESDAIERHPEVIDVLTELSEREGLGESLGSNGYDPAAYAKALAEALAPYRQEPLTDAPELVFGLANLAAMLKHDPNEASALLL
jgi:hypothetical protein